MKDAQARENIENVKMQIFHLHNEIEKLDKRIENKFVIEQLTSEINELYEKEIEQKREACKKNEILVDAKKVALKELSGIRESIKSEVATVYRKIQSTEDKYKNVMDGISEILLKIETKNAKSK